ncbi:putative enterotoxin [Ophiocordyceps unilateralis]|uniref:Enterotoxin n=1 Tax=Ophiocordyceps unilateralis TaxID=268505 RepID=A0A2A9PMQ0_OPHUN|nr:putative enterotoxin [Ophiocordyceps unilateralis]
MHIRRATILAFLWLQWPSISSTSGCFGSLCQSTKVTPLGGPSAYRVDRRDPKTIKAAGGFRAKGKDFSIYKHAELGSKNTAYVSTSQQAANGAEIFATPPPPKGLRSFKDYKGQYLYDIHPTSNFVDTELTLGPWSTHREYELLAAGGIPFAQIKGWTHLPRGSDSLTSERKYVRNPDYDPARWEGQSWNKDPQYQLAGFTEGMDRLNDRAPKFHPHTREPYKQFKDQSESGLETEGLKFIEQHGKVPGIASFEPCFGLGGRVKRDANDCWLRNKEVADIEVFTPDTNGEKDGLTSEALKEESAVVDSAAEGELASLTDRLAESEFATVLQRLLLTDFLKGKKMSVSELRARFSGYQPLNKLAKPRALLRRLNGHALTVAVLGVWVKDVIEVFVSQITTAFDKFVTVTSIIPVVGCLTSSIARKDGVDGALCVVGDVLLFSPLWPFGIAVHAFRFLSDIAGQKFKAIRMWHDVEEFQRVRRQDWEAVLKGIVGYFQSETFREEVLESEFNVERAGFAFAASQIVGLLKTARESKRANETDQMHTEAALFNATVQVYETMCQPLFKRKVSMVKEKQQAAKTFVRQELVKFNNEFANRSKAMFKGIIASPTPKMGSKDSEENQIDRVIRERLGKPISIDIQPRHLPGES